MPKRHVVQLTGEERQRCMDVVRAGSAPARTIMHAQVLLKADSGPHGAGWTDQAIADAFGVSTVTVAHIRTVMASEGLEAALDHYRGPRREYRRKLDGHQEAYLVALACSKPPEGRERWSLRLLANRMVELGYVDTVSYNTVGRVLKKTTCSPGAACAGASRRGRMPSS